MSGMDLRQMANQCDEWAIEEQMHPLAAREYVSAAMAFDERQDYLEAKAAEPFNDDREVAELSDRLDRIRTMCTEVVTTSVPQTATAMLAADIRDLCGEP